MSGSTGIVHTEDTIVERAGANGRLAGPDGRLYCRLSTVDRRLSTVGRRLSTVQGKEASDGSREHRLVSIIDNTFPSPVNFNPASLGFDLVLHSATKYLNGHTDLVAGAVVGRHDLVRKVKRKLDHLGGTLDPHGCSLLHRGLKTLCLRVRAQNDGALALARWLERHEGVDRVIYPGLAHHPDHDRAGRWFRGFGGVLALEPRGGVPAAERLLARLQLPFVAPSLGGVETLVTRPATTSHSGVSPEARRALGITDSLVRVSVGIEAVEDLIADFQRALG